MKKENEVLVNFFMNEKLKTDLDVIAARERKTLKEILNGLVESFVKVHGDGNNQYKLTQFSNDKMMACPALFRPILTWRYWLNNAPEKEVKEVQRQIILIDKEVCKIV